MIDRGGGGTDENWWWVSNNKDAIVHNEHSSLKTKFQNKHDECQLFYLYSFSNVYPKLVTITCYHLNKF